MQKLLKKDKIQPRKIILCIALVGIILVPTVEALGVGPMRLDITIEKGKETELIKYIQVTNPDTNPLHISGSVTGSIGQFIELDPGEFDLPPGPGIMTPHPRPYKYVKVMIKVPRELPENEYNGEILFTEKPVSGGVLTTAAQLGVRVNLKIGTMAEAVFPTYINGMIVLLVILLALSIITTVRKRRKK